MGSKSAGSGGMQGDVPAFDLPPPSPQYQPNYLMPQRMPMPFGGMPQQPLPFGGMPQQPMPFGGIQQGRQRPIPFTPPVAQQPMPMPPVAQQPMPMPPVAQQPMPQRPIPFTPPVAQVPFQADLGRPDTVPRPPITNQGPGSGLAPGPQLNSVFRRGRPASPSARGIGGGVPPEVAEALRLALEQPAPGARRNSQIY
jgi:hypothetical protein